MNFLNKIFSGNTLYYPGCLTKFAALDLEKKNKNLLSKIGIEFIMLSDLEMCCGSPVLRAGYLDEFEKIAQQNNQIFVDHGVSQIITNCPACLKMFSKDYPAALGDQWKISVKHTSQIFHQALLEKRLKLNPRYGKVTYHDPCHLGRQMNVYNEPRALIEACGYDLIEMKFDRKESYCCGGGGGVQTNNPELASKIAKERINQAQETRAEILCTACPMCYLHLQRNMQNEKFKVVELIELIEDSVNYGKSE